MKIAHEAPLSIFDLVDSLTDYSYALVHLFEESKEYRTKFLTLSKSGREIILDNSVFELEEVYDAESYIEWVNILKPTWYIIPDALNDKDVTISQFDNWMTKYNNTPGLKIAVPQGSTYQEFIDCYKYIEPHVDKVAITFDPIFIRKEYLTSSNQTLASFFSQMRIKLIDRMVSDGIINTSKRHHLLGCGVPQEFIHYKGMNFIDSVDTSNPVIHGFFGERYSECGLDDKKSIKLYTLINAEVSANQIEDITFNIKKFREFCRK